MQEYKKSSGRMFPTWSEVLEVLQKLGISEGVVLNLRKGRRPDALTARTFGLSSGGGGSGR